MTTYQLQQLLSDIFTTFGLGSVLTAQRNNLQAPYNLRIRASEELILTSIIYYLLDNWDIRKLFWCYVGRRDWKFGDRCKSNLVCQRARIIDAYMSVIPRPK